ncbi:MAG: PEP-CTERM sorting domain-containing protein [Fimbriimonas sp.]
MKKWALILVVSAVGTNAFGVQIVSRATLANLLGVDGQTENFEGFTFEPLVQAISLSSNTLDSTTNVLGTGTGKVKVGAQYEAVGAGNSVQWNNDAYFGLNSKTIATLNSPTRINYDGLVKGSGVDLHHYVGFLGSNGANLEGNAKFYRNSTLLGTVDFSLPEAANNSFFLGWFENTGISHVVITATGDYSFTPAMDDHLYGAEVVPEPATLAALAIGVGLMRRRNKK